MPEATRAERPPRAPSLDAGAQSAPAAAAHSRRIAEQARLVLLGMRPRQWTKNLLLFAGVTFAGRLLDVAALSRALVAFAIFCLLAGATYLLNDLADLRGDRLHPTKRLRALASGRLSPRAAWLGIAAALALAALLTLWLHHLPQSTQSLRLASLWPPRLAAAPSSQTTVLEPYARFGGSGLLFVGAAVAYVALMVAYTFRLKHIVLLDVFAIAGGFVLRAMAGAFAVTVKISPWLYLCTILLALFLALGKRRQELLLLSAQASGHRPILGEYTPQLLDQLITIVTAATIMAYSLYTFQGETGDQRLMVTIPFVLYGIFRYLYLVYVRNEGGSPEEVLLRDAHIYWSVLLCAGTVAVVLYVLPK